MNDVSEKKAADVLVIGIAGGSGSGKTTLTRQVVDTFGSSVAVLHHDSYYKTHHTISFEDRCKLNYDHPDAFDTGLLIQAVRDLRSGKDVLCPVYDYTIHDRTSDVIHVPSAPVVIVEGILIFADKELCDLMDIKIFVDTDADVRILRRILRDVNDRGRSVDSVIDQYLTTVKPMHEQFVEPSRRHADIIVPEGGYNSVARDLVLQRIRAHLERK